jgi:hypothetical protein
VEARGLTEGGILAFSTRPWLSPFARWFEPTDPRSNGFLDLARLNALADARGLRLENGLPLRFGGEAPAPGHPYELVIFETGKVPTRDCGPGMLHDWFNALCWLRWPAIKARLNRLQADAIRAGTAWPGRGRLRDTITLFDESGALLLTEDAERVEQWRSFDWQRLFVSGRSSFADQVGVLIVGHALLEKLLSPYKSVCAQALPVMQSPPPLGHGLADLDAALDALDQRVAQSLEADTLERSRFGPLPLLGIPGWWSANEDPAFYNDSRVFRQGRQGRERR